MAKNPWLADAAKGATMQIYEIRTVVDFLKVPEDRRRICLREFDAWLYMQTAVPDLLIACGARPEQIRLRDHGVFAWNDDGKASVAITIHDDEPQSADAVATPMEPATLDPSRMESKLEQDL